MVVALELVEGLVLVGAHDVGHVTLGVDVADLGLRILQVDVVADRLDQVRFTQADTAVHEQRVVGRVARVLCDLHRRGARQLVALTGDQRIEGEARIEAGALVAAADGLDRGLLRRRRELAAAGRGADLGHRRRHVNVGRRRVVVATRRTAGRRRARHRDRRAGGGTDTQLHGHLAQQFDRQRLDARQEAILNELQDEAVWRVQHHTLVAGLGRERADPGVELL